MATAEQKPELLIGQDASNLAFRLGQAIQRDLITRAGRFAAARNAQVVSAVDVEAAAVELGLAGTGMPEGDRANGEEGQGESNAV